MIDSQIAKPDQKVLDTKRSSVENLIDNPILEHDDHDHFEKIIEHDDHDHFEKINSQNSGLSKSEISGVSFKD